MDEHKIIILDSGRNYDVLRGKINDNVTLVKGHIYNQTILKDSMKDVDIVIHLKGGGGNKLCLADPAKAVKIHIIGTNYLVDEAIRSKVSLFIYASTHYVYPTNINKDLIFTENSEIIPDSFYGNLKSVAEHYIKERMPYIILRLANIYGYGIGINTKWGGVINKLLKQSLTSSEITLTGNVAQLMNFIHVNDVTNAIRCIINSKYKNKTYNVCSTKGARLDGIANIIADSSKKLNKKMIIINHKLNDVESSTLPNRFLSNRKITSDLDWSPKIGLSEGIDDTILKIIEETSCLN